MFTLTKRLLPFFLGAFLSVQVVSCNAVEKIVGIENISQTNLLSQLETKKPPLILDVRSPPEYDAGHIPGAINIEFRQLQKRIEEIQQFQDSTVVVYCETGIRAQFAEIALSQAGFKSILHLEGHMSAWRSNSLPIEKIDSGKSDS